MRIIGLDVGEKRIGVARADSSTRIAVPLGFIEVNGSEWQRIARIANLNGTNLFIVGLPRSNEGAETAQSVYVRNFVKELIRQIPEVKVRFQDESLTSVEAEERLKSRKRQYEKGEIDAEAAAIILQDFLEGLVATSTSENAFDKAIPSSILPQNSTAASGAQSNSFEKNPGELQAIKDLAKKRSDKVKLKTKKAKHKMKTATKWISGIAIVAILGLIATGTALFIRDQRYQEYQRQFAEIEAQMKSDVFDFTILPGENIFDIKQKFIDLGYTASEVETAFAADYDFAFLENRPAKASLEGFLYGETHQFYKDTPVEEVIETFLKEMEKVIVDNDLENKYANQGLTLFEGITLASIVQKEAPTPEQPTVSQVFLSRLAYGIPLGSDVTVSYALDVIDPDRQTYGDNQAALQVDSCYNTRLHAGLPCGPISNPGISALLAVAEPANSTYLYFLTGDDGLMYYSYTEAEHLQNIADHCQNLCSISL